MKGDRVAQLELILRSHPEGLRKSDIARRIGVHRSTVGRYIEELKQYSEIYEDNGLIKIIPRNDEEPLALSVYESLALNMGVEMLIKNSEFRTPHLASGLRKIAMGMQSYAPKVSRNIMTIADQIESEATSSSNRSSEILEVLIDAWVSGRIVRIMHTHPDKGNPDRIVEEETELAPYFIGFVENEKGRNPVTVTGRLRHTSEIITLDITKIKSVAILNETYTIPDNLKAFRRMETPANPEYVIDTIPLVLLVKQKSALNSFTTLSHGEIQTEKRPDGTRICRLEAENSIELILRIIQCGDAVEILEPAPFRAKFKAYLENILNIYKK
ncbi:MAG: WYL domain-containing transcriptional regulator [Spirochaetales bacterium]|nr:WYL domain-containing transcriptional regulator [Spirochaetales bacterium]